VRACDAAGNILSEGPSTPLFGEGIPSMGGILRPRLHGVMRAAIEAAGIRVRTGVAADRYEEHAGHVAVHSSDGTVGQHRFVVAADGLFSRSRAMLFPHLSGPAFTGQGCWRAVVSRPADVTATWVYCAQYAKAGSTPSRRT
jgi:2-polyprenyl-6-methoxyphenol hydroxylase-like FAD-dependent oxidoreductase